MTAKKKPVLVRCDVCGTTFETADARKRRCSDTCRQRARAERVGAPGDTKLSQAVARELRAAKVLNSYAGQLALHLAKRMEKPGATGTAQLARELDRTMDRALGRTSSPAASSSPSGEAAAAEPVEDDEVTRARRERDAKLGTATG